MNEDIPRATSGQTEPETMAKKIEILKTQYLERRLKELNALRIAEPSAEGVIDDIDFDKLRELFTERVGRIDPEFRAQRMAQMQFAPKERIIPMRVPSTGDNAYHGAYADACAIKLAVSPEDSIESSIEKPEERILRDRREKLESLDYFRVIVHEEAHLVSTVVPDSTYYYGRYTESRSGFERFNEFYYTEGGAGSEQVKKGHQILLRSFNEGVTEMITIEISFDYLARYGFRGCTFDDLEEAARNIYDREKLLVEAIIEIIAQDAQVPEDVVWTAIQEAYFSQRNNPFSQDIINLLRETVDDEFWERMVLLGNDSESTNNILLEHELKTLSDTGKLSPWLLRQISLVLQKPKPQV